MAALSDLDGKLIHGCGTPMAVETDPTDPNKVIVRCGTCDEKRVISITFVRQVVAIGTRL